MAFGSPRLVTRLYQDHVHLVWPAPLFSSSYKLFLSCQPLERLFSFCFFSLFPLFVCSLSNQSFLVFLIATCRSCIVASLSFMKPGLCTFHPILLHTSTIFAGQTPSPPSTLGFLETAHAAYIHDRLLRRYTLYPSMSYWSPSSLTAVSLLPLSKPCAIHTYEIHHAETQSPF